MEGTTPSSIFAARPIATGIVVGIATLLPHPLLPPDLSLSLGAIMMGMVAGVYFGFAVMRGNNFQQQVEFNVSLLFVIAALLGVWVSPWFIPAAFFARTVYGILLITTAPICALSPFLNGTFRGASSSMSLLASGLLCCGSETACFSTGALNLPSSGKPRGIVLHSLAIKSQGFQPDRGR
jgi:hypothetical protein